MYPIRDAMIDRLAKYLMRWVVSADALDTIKLQAEVIEVQRARIHQLELERDELWGLI